jgi:tripeptidyl-peptidase I
LKLDQITDLVGVDNDQMTVLTEWIESSGLRIVEIAKHKDWVTVEGNIESIEKTLETELAIWENKEKQLRKIGCVGSYSIPDELEKIIQFIPGLTSFTSGIFRPTIQVASEKDKDVGAAVTPATIYATYQTDTSGSHGSKLGSQGVVQFGLGANFNEADLQTFFGTYATDLETETCGTAYGTNNGKIRGSVESNLDVQYVMAVGKYVNTSTYKLGYSANIEDGMLEYAYIVNNQTDPVLVQSISYGEYGGSYDNSTVQRFNYELQKMAAKGITVLLASGDNGVGCDATGSSQEFDFPSSPYITMVGATYVSPVSGAEIGATLSSGGFSKDYFRPSWQDAAVGAYFASATYAAHKPSESFYADGRAYPDVAAFGFNVEVVSKGESIAVSGTSFSSPILAGVVALINSELLKAGHAPLGWLNPWIYAQGGSMFVDVTEGSNPYEKCDGFYASAGWDPVTGWGTPVYPLMLKAAFAAVEAST